jgi:dihydropteroate synthase
MIAASRKRFLGALTGHEAPEQRGAASLAAALWAIQAGANVLRVHDVRETTDALTLFLSLNTNKEQSHV